MRKIFPAIAVGVTMLSMAGATFAYAVTGKDVQLSVDGSSRAVSTRSGTVGQLLDRQGIQIGPHDVVAPDAASPLDDGSAVAVRYGRQVTVTVDGVPQTFWTTATTVQQALATERIEVDRSDDLSTSRSSTIGREGLTLTVSTQKTVALDDAGTKRRLTTNAATVGDALVDAGIDVRHLRPFKSAAERELGLAEHVLGQQALRGRGADAAGLDDERVQRQVVEDCLELHVAPARRGLDDGT